MSSLQQLISGAHAGHDPFHYLPGQTTLFPIPARSVSALADPGELQCYSPGIAAGLWQFLTLARTPAFQRDRAIGLQDTSVAMTFQTDACPSVLRVPQTLLDRQAAHVWELLLTAAWAGLAFPATRVALAELFTALGQDATNAVPATRLTSLAPVEAVQHGVYRVTNTLEIELGLQVERHEISHLDEAGVLPGPLKTRAEIKALLQTPRLHPRDTLLTTVLRGGGRALLIGPPGSFKTTSAKRAALALGAHLVILKGHPGIEAPDFYGTVQPTLVEENGVAVTRPTWVDGPMTEAFYRAQTGPVVFLIDEVLRIHSDYLNVLIGGMDDVQSDELTAMGLTPTTVSPSGWYAALRLPNGEVLTCPKEHLSWVLTTNMGADHVQVAGKFDAALLSRIDAVIEYQRAEEDERRALYLPASGQNRALVNATLALEDWTTVQANQADSLLLRPLEPRKCLSLLQLTVRLAQADTTLAEAFLQACEVVVTGYVCARTDQGKLSGPARQRTIEQAQKCAAEHLRAS